MKMRKAEWLTISQRAYRLLLTAYPTRFRREYGPQMALAFRDDVRFTLQTDGVTGLVWLWFLVLTDLAKTALAEHIWEVFHMSIEKLQRWSGPAIAIGGPLWVVSLFWFVRFSQGGAGPILSSVPFIITATMMALGLVGLAHSLPARAKPGLLLGMALVGLIVSNAGMLLLFLTTENLFGPPSAWSQAAISLSVLSSLGGGLMFLSLVVMGIVAFASKSLGKLSLAPLVPPAAGVMISLLIVTDAEIAALFTAAYLVYSAGWVLVGIALWTTNQHHQPDLAAPA